MANACAFWLLAAIRMPVGHGHVPSLCGPAGGRPAPGLEGGPPPFPAGPSAAAHVFAIDTTTCRPPEPRQSKPGTCACAYSCGTGPARSNCQIRTSNCRWHGQYTSFRRRQSEGHLLRQQYSYWRQTCRAYSGSRDIHSPRQTHTAAGGLGARNLQTGE